MRAPRFFAPSLPSSPDVGLELEGEEAHHALHVLRLRAGAEVELFDGQGGAGRFAVESAGKATLSLRLLRRVDDARDALAPVTLAFAPPRPKRSLALVEKATELGITRFVPLVTRRTRAGIPDRGLDKLRRRALEASKQCGRNRLPTFSTTLTLDQLVARELPGQGLALLPDTRDARPLREALRARATPVGSILFAVGPEGGFEDDERALLRASGFEPVILGRTILRVETAALAILACLRYELG